MSAWHNITDKEDIEFSDDKKELHIFFDSDDDDLARQYVSVPVELLKEVLGKDGEIRRNKRTVEAIIFSFKTIESNLFDAINNIEPAMKLLKGASICANNLLPDDLK